MDESELEEELRNFGVDVHDIGAVDPVELSYITAYPGEEVNHMEMGKVLNAFIDLETESDWEPSRVEATVLRFEDEVMNTGTRRRSGSRGCATTASPRPSSRRASSGRSRKTCNAGDRDTPPTSLRRCDDDARLRERGPDVS